MQKQLIITDLFDIEREIDLLVESNEKISFHAEYEEEESAWKKVTPVGNFDSPDCTPDRSMNKKSSSRRKSILKPSNLSEGECSSQEDDVEILSTGKRSNYTNTSIVKLGNDDASSMNSGLSGSNFSYLKSYSNNMAQNHRARSSKKT